MIDARNDTGCVPVITTVAETLTRRAADDCGVLVIDIGPETSAFHRAMRTPDPRPVDGAYLTQWYFDRATPRP